MFPKRKFGNFKVKNHHGYSFDSKLETAVFDLLKLMEKAGEVRDIRVKPNVFLTRSRIRMIPDFGCFHIEMDRDVYVEAKGYATDVWAIKKKLFKHYGDRPLLIYAGTYKSPKFVEMIVPCHHAEGELDL